MLLLQSIHGIVNSANKAVIATIGIVKVSTATPVVNVDDWRTLRKWEIGWLKSLSVAPGKTICYASFACLITIWLLNTDFVNISFYACVRACVVGCAIHCKIHNSNVQKCLTPDLHICSHSTAVRRPLHSMLMALERQLRPYT